MTMPEGVHPKLICPWRGYLVVCDHSDRLWIVSEDYPGQFIWRRL